MAEAQNRARRTPRSRRTLSAAHPRVQHRERRTTGRVTTVTPTPERTRPALNPKIANTYLACYGIAAALFAIGLIPANAVAVLIVIVVAAVSAGVVANKPVTSWPWWAMVSAGVFWAAAAGARDMTGSTGDMDSTRSLIPDALALPGYALYIGALVMLIGGRNARHDHNRGSLIDATIVALAAFLLVWEFLIATTLNASDVATHAQLSIIIYPVIGVGIVALAFQLAYSHTERLPVHTLLAAAMVFLLAGDITYALDELGLFSVGELRDLPYLLSGAAMGGAALHPSMRYTDEPTDRPARPLTRSRVALLAFALSLPGLLFVYADLTDQAAGHRWPFLAAMIATGVLATTRLLHAVREQNRASERLAWRATHDSMTGLPNRAMILETLRKLNRRDTAVVAFFDLDDFKMVNDVLGHTVGDELITYAAGRISAALGDTCTLGRLGGDEFVVIAPGGPERIEFVVDAVRGALSEPFALTAGVVHTAASIGVTFSDHTRSADELLRDADTAMYHAKAAGKNTFAVYSSDMHAELERRVLIEQQLRGVLTAGAVVTHFQPIVSLSGGTVLGFEALFRCDDPSRYDLGGHRAPATIPEFISVAEDTGLINELGENMLDQACAAIAQWRREIRDDLYVTVNVSVRQLTDDVAGLVARMLERHQLDGDALCIEITESSMLDGTGVQVDQLHELRRLGVAIAVDDFGTGYSSLSYLRQMPATAVKIDRSFIDDIDTGTNNDLVDAIVSMSHALGLTCIAEGVERPTQSAALDAIGCDAGQGYLWSRPVRAGDVPGTVAAIAEMNAEIIGAAERTGVQSRTGRHAARRHARSAR